MSAEGQNKSLTALLVIYSPDVPIPSYLLQVRDSVQASAAQRHTAASMSDTHDAPASSSP